MFANEIVKCQLFDNLTKLTLSRHRVIPMPTPWVARQDALYSHKATFPWAIFLYSLYPVGAAGWRIAAFRTKQRRDGPLVKANKPYEYYRKQLFDNFKSKKSKFQIRNSKSQCRLQNSSPHGKFQIQDFNRLYLFLTNHLQAFYAF